MHRFVHLVLQHVHSDNIENDPNLVALLKAETPAVSIFGKTWKLHSQKSD